VNSTALHLERWPRGGWIAALLAILLAGCAGPGTRRAPDYRQDGPPTTAVDIDAIPDAVPRVEPLCQPCLRPYEVQGLAFRPLASAAGYQARGVASWYGREFHGRPTANGERYDMLAMTAAHPTLPIPSYVRVTHLANGRSVVVRINDRGPFKRGRLIDLSYVAAAKLGLVGDGSGPVEVRSVLPGGSATPAVITSNAASGRGPPPAVHPRGGGLGGAPRRPGGAPPPARRGAGAGQRAAGKQRQSLAAPGTGRPAAAGAGGTDRRPARGARPVGPAPAGALIQAHRHEFRIHEHRFRRPAAAHRRRPFT
jgi:rare lipoprotein A